MCLEKNEKLLATAIEKIIGISEVAFGSPSTPTSADAAIGLPISSASSLSACFVTIMKNWVFVHTQKIVHPFMVLDPVCKIVKWEDTEGISSW